ncbi:phosphotransferase enzyme family protein [Actinomadura chibensis]|nr:phosphotransferase [Actinomadura chibensis]
MSTELLRGYTGDRELTPLRSSWGACRVFRAGRHSDADALVHKVWRTESERARADQEAAVLGALDAAGFTGAARLLDKTVIHHDGAAIVITSYPYVVGEPLDSDRPEHLHDVARLMAAMHSIPAPASPPLRPPVNLGAAARHLTAAEEEVLGRLWEHSLAGASEFGIRYIHGDLNSENVIIDGRGAGGPVLIDFEFSRLDSPLWDLASFTLERDAGGAFTVVPEEKCQAFLRSYTAALGTPEWGGWLQELVPAFRVLFLHRVLADVSGDRALAGHAADLLRVLLSRLS